MKRNLACARAEEATEWLQGYDPDDGHGPVGDQAADPAAMFTQPVVVAAFIAGAEKADDLAEAEFAIERAVGQRQLDEAGALMMEAAALFLGYGEHHQARADEFEKSGDVEACAASLRKARVNMSMAVSLREWLQCAAPTVDGEPVPSGQVIDFPERFANREGYGSNVRPVSIGPLADPDVVEGLMAGAGLIDAATPLSVVKATAFRLQTPDPRFDPAQPVVVNGFLYHPATEGLCKTN